MPDYQSFSKEPPSGAWGFGARNKKCRPLQGKTVRTIDLFIKN
jgi:hypothetical protein